jgi:hypothetical protein
LTDDIKTAFDLASSDLGSPPVCSASQAPSSKERYPQLGLLQNYKRIYRTTLKAQFVSDLPKGGAPETKEDWYHRTLKFRKAPAAGSP